MGAKAELDFASLLDDLIAASNEPAPIEHEDEAVSVAPSLHVDLLDQLERLQTENLALFPDRAMQAYGDVAEAGEARRQQAGNTPNHLQPALEDLFFLDPESIAKELGIRPKTSPEELDRARRAFAMRYHPDRVPEELRERAALRMQIANVLIDDAKRRKR